jgi:hypothetical protein
MALGDLCHMVCDIDPNPALKTGRRVHQHVDETEVVPPYRGVRRLLIALWEQGIAGSNSAHPTG